MKLLGSLASPYVRKVRVAMLLKEVPHEFESVDVMTEQVPLHRHNPLGKIPCLVRGDGSALYDSRVITEYLEVCFPQPLLLPVEPLARVEVRRYEALADGILDAAILYRWELTQRPQPRRDPDWLRRQAGKVSRGLAALATEVEGREHCVDGMLSLADIAVGSMLAWLAFRLPEFDWPADHPTLAATERALHRLGAWGATAPQSLA